jgi:ATP-binding cassette subfamily C (CFTR/MRP) protein 1
VNYTSVIAVVFITIMVAAPWMSSAMILLMVLFLFVTLYFEKTYIAYQRMEAESRGPLISHFTETLYAAGSVRAYGLEREFRRDNRYHMNFNNRHYYALQAAAQWLAMRLDWMAAGMVGILGVMLVICAIRLTPGSLALVFPTRCSFRFR